MCRWVRDSLGEFLERVWLSAKVGRVEVATYEQYRWAVTRHIVPLIGAVRLGDLTLSWSISGWGSCARLPTVASQAGCHFGPDGGKVLSMALEEAVQRGRLARNPVPLTQPPWPARAHGRLGGRWMKPEPFSLLLPITGCGPPSSLPGDRAAAGRDVGVALAGRRP